MANFIENSTRAPELLDTSLKALLVPAANFVGTLTALPGATVDLIGDDGVVYGTFTLTTVGAEVESGLLTNLPPRMRIAVTSGPNSGRFNISVGVAA